MPLEDILLLATEDSIIEVISQLGAIGKWLQAIGVIFLLWVIFQVVNFFLNRKRIKKLDIINERLERIEKKLNKK